LRRRGRLPSWLSWQLFQDYLLILLGAVLLGLSMHLFFIPSQLVAGGLSGAAQIINSFTGFPIGVLVFLANIPLFVVGWRYLGGRRFLARTIFAAFVYSAVVDGLRILWPDVRLTNDLLLNALYGGVMGGVGGGLVFRARATSGGTDILARIIERRWGIPISQAYLYTDGVVVFLAALAFSWEHALYAIVALYIGGVVVEAVLTGSNVVRVAFIITQQPEGTAARIIADLGRGVTNWSGKGMYTGEERPILLCVVSRAEIGPLKTIVHEVDPSSFVIIGQAQEAFGEGFRLLNEDA
jgi:uncharacterized membrane-anchored protein YitT (DUF2179 family)